ncbi:MAG: hypothetical protein HFE63_03990 [Clostridiales bacterium]|nr:hypothetical protein [Clostridiales bacterium]
MKKFGSLALAALMVTVLGATASAVSNFEAAAGTPTVDGQKDDAYVCAGANINVDAADGAATGVAYTAWDNDYFYVLVEVTDSTVNEDVTSVWANDSVEVYINLSGTEGEINSINAAQYTYGYKFTEFAGGGKHREDNVANVKHASVKTDKGYNIEIAIPWGSDYTPKADASFTVAFGVNDNTDNDSSAREFQTFAGTDQGKAWWTADANWDNMTLTSKKYEAPKVEASTNTADMGIVAALASLAASGVAVLSLKKRK